MAYEIDFLPVGDGERSGDAIALRFGNLNSPSTQTVVVLDGGTKDSGSALVEHIETFYKTSVVDVVICTHSDSDHASGLTVVLDNLNVGSLFMHLPWNHAANIDDLFKDPRVTKNSLIQRFKKSLDNARELESLAKQKGIRISEPFSDTVRSNDNFSVLGPSTKFYEDLLLSFRAAPEPVVESSCLQKAVVSAKEAIKWVAEDWGIETLSEPDAGASSAENNSSVVLLFRHEGSTFIFTSDAGVPGLTGAAACAATLGFDPATANALQVPHHGSKHNVGPAILNLLVGPKRKDEQCTKTAVVSASKDSPKHPSKKVVNAFMRRGAKVFATQGQKLWRHSKDAPARPWGDAIALTFSNRVEE
jgi:beta-lactamase superfamily II metal-dependent hydrolase